MAGGQERILRNRIRAVQATKKITRAMELIAGSRIVKAQQRVHAAVPVQRADHRGGPAPGRRRRQLGQPDPARRAARGAHDLLRDHHRRPWSVRRLQLRRPAGGRGGDQGRGASGARTTSTVAGRSQGRELPALPRLQAGPGVPRLLRQPDLRGRPARSPSTSMRPLRRGQGRPGGARLHPLRLGREPGGRPAAARPAGAGAGRRPGPGRAEPQRRGRAPTTSTSRHRRRSWTRWCPATSRPAPTPRCSTPRPPSTPSASGP